MQAKYKYKMIELLNIETTTIFDQTAKLISLYNNELETTRILKQQKIELNNRIEQLETELKMIKNKYDNLKIGKIIESSEETDAKEKLSKMIREIDNCIALLDI